MPLVRFITHPDVVIDAAVAVTDWALSPLGRQRMARAAAQPWAAGVTSVVSSAERKATDAAGLLATARGLRFTVLDALGENDRSATGYLPKAEFEAVADAFFAQPEVSVRGWERAADAQRRIVQAVAQAIRMAPAAGDLAIVSHGGVGALLLCHLRGVAISRAADQPGDGGGHMFAFDRDSRRLVSGWQRIEA